MKALYIALANFEVGRLRFKGGGGPAQVKLVATKKPVVDQAKSRFANERRLAKYAFSNCQGGGC